MKNKTITISHAICCVSGNIVYIGDVNRSVLTEFKCIACDNKLIAKQGPKNTDHFSHPGGKNVDNLNSKCAEGLVHYLSKVQLANIANISSCLSADFFCKDNLTSSYFFVSDIAGIDVSIDSIDEEFYIRQSKTRSDLMASCKVNSCKEEIHFEIVSRNKINPVKMVKLRDLDKTIISFKPSRLVGMSLLDAIRHSLSSIECFEIITISSNLKRILVEYLGKDYSIKLPGEFRPAYSSVVKRSFMYCIGSGSCQAYNEVLKKYNKIYSFLGFNLDNLAIELFPISDFLMDSSRIGCLFGKHATYTRSFFASEPIDNSIFKTRELVPVKELALHFSNMYAKCLEAYLYRHSHHELENYIAALIDEKSDSYLSSFDFDKLSESFYVQLYPKEGSMSYEFSPSAFNNIILSGLCVNGNKEFQIGMKKEISEINVLLNCILSTVKRDINDVYTQISKWQSIKPPRKFMENVYGKSQVYSLVRNHLKVVNETLDYIDEIESHSMTIGKPSIIKMRTATKFVPYKPSYIEILVESGSNIDLKKLTALERSLLKEFGCIKEDNNSPWEMPTEEECLELSKIQIYKNGF